ncbi:MAG: hypothetical protein WAP35_05105 [Solirubrobacterales bacterium]
MSYLPDSQAESKPYELRDQSAALTSRGWIPTDRWDDLDGLSAEHQRLIAQRNEVGTERNHLKRTYEEQDENQHEEMTSAMAENRSPERVEITPPEEREKALAELDQMHAAATEALDRFIDSTVEKIEELTPTLLADLDGDSAEAEERVIEARKVLAEADATQTRINQMREWVKRNGGVHERNAFRNIPAMRFVAWDALSAPYISPQDEIAAQEATRPRLDAPVPDDDSELDVSEASVLELAEWINTDDPTLEQIVSAASSDAAIAQKLLMADQHAHYTARPEVEAALNDVINEAVA